MPDVDEAGPIGARRLHNPRLNQGSAFPLTDCQALRIKRLLPPVAQQVSEADLGVGLIDPPSSNILNVSLHTAGRVAAYVFDHDLAGIPRPDDIDAHIRATVYKPFYPGGA